MAELCFDQVLARPQAAGAFLLRLDLAMSEKRLALIGANGSGKSSFLRLCNGLLLPQEGAVRFDGLDSRKDGVALRRRVGFLFQNAEAQIVMPTPFEDVVYGLKAHGWGKPEREARAQASLERFGLGARRDDPAYALSGGEKQRLALAGLLALEPDMLLMDEPTASLDLGGRKLFIDMLAALDQQAILSTHDLDLAMMCERAIWLDGGRVVADGAPLDVIAQYRRASLG